MSTTESYVFSMWKTRPHCSRVSQFKPTPRSFQRAMLRMREVRTLRPWMWKLCAFKLPRTVSRNQRPVGSPETSKNCDFINNSTNVFNDSLPEHPFAACLIDGVPVNAFLDTGSMKSFFSDKVHNIFDLDCGRLRISRSHSVVPQLL